MASLIYLTARDPAGFLIGWSAQGYVAPRVLAGHEARRGGPAQQVFYQTAEGDWTTDSRAALRHPTREQAESWRARFGYRAERYPIVAFYVEETCSFSRAGEDSRFAS